MIQLARDLNGPCLAPGGSVVAVGAFDGVHLGHQHLLATVRQHAGEQNLTPAVVSFEPLPRAFFSPRPVPRLTPVRQKLEAFTAAGMQKVLLLRFNSALAHMTPADFVRRVLVQRLGVQQVYVGEDFRFGHKQAGDFDLLQSMGPDGGFTAHAVDPVVVDGESVSASRIRQYLAAGDFTRAQSLLGRPFRIDGHVARGEKLGRTLGYPTANVHLGSRVAPVHGVFAVRVEVAGMDGIHAGVANLGVRPTVNQVPEPLLEVYLFDFAGDLYGRRMRTTFVAKLRDEETFDDIQALQTRMDGDATAARRILGLAPAEA